MSIEWKDAGGAGKLVAFHEAGEFAKAGRTVGHLRFAPTPSHIDWTRAACQALLHMRLHEADAQLVPLRAALMEAGREWPELPTARDLSEKWGRTSHRC